MTYAVSVTVMVEANDEDQAWELGLEEIAQGQGEIDARLV